MSQPGAVISLTTDFGLKDPFVGVMKGAILSRFADARIVDLTHDILAYWPAEAGFWLAKSFRYFPDGSVHVAVVAPGVGTDRDIIVSEAYGHMFLAPDNGLLHMVLANADAKTFDTSAGNCSAIVGQEFCADAVILSPREQRLYRLNNSDLNASLTSQNVLVGPQRVPYPMGRGELGNGVEMGPNGFEGFYGTVCEYDLGKRRRIVHFFFSEVR